MTSDHESQQEESSNHISVVDFRASGLVMLRMLTPLLGKKHEE